jgi:N-acetylmuramoyl-L-alanine amidase
MEDLEMAASVAGKAPRILRAGAILASCLWVMAFPAAARSHGPQRTVPIDMVVIHSTGGPTCDAGTGQPVWIKGGTLEQDLRTIEQHPILGIHYMIDRDGAVRPSVPEDQVAYHVYTYSGRSIAIELINDGDGVDPFPAAQLDALVALLRDIVARRAIARDGIKRHSDLDHGRLACDRAQRRKVDPGSAFPFDVVLDAVFPRSKDTPAGVPANIPRATTP